ncbi:hypothetical protein BU24DRAFT_319607, partial [Aaosphaeria arxii CBS 175.79]
RDLLEQLNLHVNEPEPVIICRACQFGLHGTVKSITDHVVEKHNHSPHVTKQLRELLKPYTIPSPTQLALRPDQSPPHPHLAIHLGNACKHCGYRTTSTELMGRHLSSKHNVKRKASTSPRCRENRGQALLGEWKEMEKRHEEEMQMMDAAAAKTDKTGWFTRTGWLQHLAKRNLVHLAHAIKLPTRSEPKLKQTARLVELLVEQSVAGLSTLARETRRWLRSAKREEIDQRPIARLQNPESQARYAGYLVMFVCYFLRI